MSDVTAYLCRKGTAAIDATGVRVDVLGSGKPVQVGTDEDGRRVVDVAVLRHGHRPVREVVAQLYKVGLVPAFGWPNASLAFERTLAKRPGEYTRDDTWSVAFTVPDVCEFWAWGLYRWSGTPGACCSNMDTPIALELPGLPSSKALPLSRSEAAPKAGKKHSVQLSNADLYPGDLYCLYAHVRLPGSETQVERRRVVGRGDGESLAPALDDLGEVVTGPVRLHARCAGQSRCRVVDAYDSLGGSDGELDVRSGRWMKDVAWASPPEADAPILATYTAVVATYGDPVTYPIASAVFGSPCFTGGRVLAAYEVEDGYEYDVQTAARAESGHSLGIVRVRPSDNRRYAIGEWVTIHIDSAQCRNTRPGLDFAWVVADPGTTGGAKPSIVPVSVDGYPRLGTPGKGGSVDYGTRGQDALQRARIYTGMIIEIHRDRDPVTADVYLAAFGRVDGVRFFFHCEADNDRSQDDAEFMADAHSAFDADDIVRVLHVGGRRFETEAVTGDDLRVIGFADGKARPCVKQLLLFYKSGGTAKMASFGFTEGQLSVMKHGDAEEQGFTGITNHIVSYEKELRPDGSDSTSILMGVPFDIGDDAWQFTGFDPVYTDAYIAKYKFDSPLRDAVMSYGIFNVGKQSFVFLQKSGNPYSCAGFGYSNTHVFLYALTGSSFDESWKVGLFEFYSIRTTDTPVIVKKIGSRIKTNVCGIDSNGKAYFHSCYSHYDYEMSYLGICDKLDGEYIYHLGNQCINRIKPEEKFSPFGSLTGPMAMRSEQYSGVPLSQAMATLEQSSLPYANAAFLSVDGRLYKNISSQIGKDIIVLSKFGYIDCLKGTITSTDTLFDIDGKCKFASQFEERGVTEIGKIIIEPIQEELWYRYSDNPPYLSGLVELFLRQRNDFYFNDKKLGFGGYSYHWTDGVPVNTYGDHSYFVPLSFPYGLSRDDVFAIKTQWEFNFVESEADGSQAPSSITKTLVTPYEDRQLSATSRPMGWTQIQTEDNEHVLQGVLIINDETSEVVDAMLWHNGDRIEAALASALGCGVTDLLGVLYLPKAAMGGGEDPDLPDDPDPGTTNGPTGFAAFCQGNPGHPSCVSNGCATVPFSEELLSQLQSVNDAVNGAHTYESDAILYRKLEHWTVLGEGASGDCEDFALTKVEALIAAGTPAGAIKLVVGKTGDGGGHAWVEVQTTNGNYALDINHTQVKLTGSLPYTDLRRQYDGDWWL